jgi:hypothetical protein
LAHSLDSSSSVNIGLSKSHIVPGMVESLFSPNKLLLASGSSFLLKGDGGAVFYSKNDKVIPIVRSNGHWLVFVSDIRALKPFDGFDPPVSSYHSNH